MKFLMYWIKWGIYNFCLIAKNMLQIKGCQEGQEYNLHKIQV